MSADPPLNLIHADETITLTCQTPDVVPYKRARIITSPLMVYSSVNVTIRHICYQWLIDEGEWEIGNKTYTIQVPLESQFKVTCEVFLEFKYNTTNSVTVYGNDTIIIPPKGML